MEYRIGKCSSCGAEYKVPASFAHNVARCKVCQGVVHLGQPGGGLPADVPSAASMPASPTPASETSRPKPIPARRVAPPATPAARPAAAQASPAPRPAKREPEPAAASGGEKPRKGGTLERIKAERQRQAAAEAPAAPAGRERAARKPALAAAAASGAAAGSGRASSRRSAAHRDDEGGEESGSARRGGRRSAAVKKKEKNPLPALISVAVLIAVGVTAYLMRDRFLGDETSAATKAPDHAATAPADAGGDAAGKAADASAPSGTSAADGSGAPADDSKGAAPAEGAGAKDAGAPAKDAGGSAPEAPKAAEVDPAAIDLSTIPDYGPVAGTTDEEWKEMNQWMQTWMTDTSAAGNRAKLKLVAMKRKAFPVILDGFKKLDFSTELGKSNGDQCQRAMMEICNGTNFDWRYTTDPKDVVFNKKVVQAWATQWDKAKDNVEYWIKMAKLDEKDPDLAKQLRAEAGSTPAPDAPAKPKDNDLDVD